MVSNAAQLLIDEAVERGSNLHDLADYAVVRGSTTRTPPWSSPSSFACSPTEHGIEFDEAVTIVRPWSLTLTTRFLPRRSRSGPLTSLRKVSPAIADIIVKLDEIAKAEYDDPRVAIIDEHDTVHMAHMDIHFGFSINGVAALHTKDRRRTPSFIRSLRNLSREVLQQDQRHHLPPLDPWGQPARQPARRCDRHRLAQHWRI